MSKEITNEKLKDHKKRTILKIENFMDALIDSRKRENQKRADKLCYWLKQYIYFLEFESRFDPKRLRKYKRGEIIKVHLGFNIGSEEGGMHYAVVLDKQNSIHSSTITILPLTSIKPGKDLSRLRDTEINLGNELYTSTSGKLSAHIYRIKKEVEELKENISSQGISKQEEESMWKKIELLNSDIRLAEKIKREVVKMKKGSIGLVNQITTISKIRIEDPKTNKGVLSGIKLSNENLDIIDNYLVKNFTNL